MRVICSDNAQSFFISAENGQKKLKFELDIRIKRCYCNDNSRKRRGALFPLKQHGDSVKKKKTKGEIWRERNFLYSRSQ